MITLGVVYGLGILSLGIVSLTLSSVVTNLSTHKNETSGLRTLTTADAGAREGVYRMVAFGSEAPTGLALNSDGVTNATVSVVDSGWITKTVTGMAENMLTRRTVSYTVIPHPGSGAFSHALYSQNELSVSGNSDITGDVYAGGDMSVNNAAATIDGNVYTSGEATIHTNASVDATVEHVHILTPPTIDVSPYHDIATDPIHGFIVANASDLTLAETATYDGIYFSDASLAEIYIDGETRSDKIVYVDDTANTLQLTKNNTDFSGILIVLGDLEINGGDFSILTDMSNPLAVYVGGDLSLKGNVDISGLVYVAGDMSSAAGGGTPYIYGSLVLAGSSGTVQSLGNVTVEYNPALSSNWANIAGVDVSGPPIISTWQEI